MSLAKEMKKLCQEPLDGIKVVMNDEDVTDVARIDLLGFTVETTNMKEFKKVG